MTVTDLAHKCIRRLSDKVFPESQSSPVKIVSLPYPHKPSGQKHFEYVYLFCYVYAQNVFFFIQEPSTSVSIFIQIANEQSTNTKLIDFAFNVPMAMVHWS